MSINESAIAHTEAFLGRLKERSQPTIYTIEGVDIIVNPDVFPPATDSRLFAANIHVKPGDRTLDLTTGAGTFSIIAGIQGATGIAVDINPAAVLNANQNFEKYNLQMKAIESDLYSNVPTEKFDYLFANGPFIEGQVKHPLDFASYGARAFTEGLLSGARERLKPDGKLLTVLAQWSDIDFFERQVVQNGMVARVTDTRSSDDGERKYIFYEVTIK